MTGKLALGMYACCLIHAPVHAESPSSRPVVMHAPDERYDVHGDFIVRDAETMDAHAGTGTDDYLAETAEAALRRETRQLRNARPTDTRFDRPQPPPAKKLGNVDKRASVSSDKQRLLGGASKGARSSAKGAHRHFHHRHHHHHRGHSRDHQSPARVERKDGGESGPAQRLLDTRRTRAWLK